MCVYIYIYFLAMVCGLQEFSSPNRDLNMPSVVKAWSLNHWTMREFPPRLKKVKNTMHCVLPFVCVVDFRNLFTYKLTCTEHLLKDTQQTDHLGGGNWWLEESGRKNTNFSLHICLNF